MLRAAFDEAVSVFGPGFIGVGLLGLVRGMDGC